jgi:hypothetical protein
MTAADWITGLLLGGLLGILGQGIRIIVGLKKLNDEASVQGKSFSSKFQGSRLGLSLLIGFIAGGLAVIGFAETPGFRNPSRELIVTLLGAGYAGTDFIEGFIRKYLPLRAKGGDA